MFAQFPTHIFWFMAPGRLGNGSEVEVLSRAPLDHGEPWDVQSAQRGFRWTQYFWNVIQRGLGDPAFQATYPALLSYLCREWNAANSAERRLDRVSLVVVIEAMPPFGSAEPTTPQHSLLETRDCAPATGRGLSTRPSQAARTVPQNITASFRRKAGIYLVQRSPSRPAGDLAVNVRPVLRAPRKG